MVRPAVCKSVFESRWVDLLTCSPGQSTLPSVDRDMLGPSAETSDVIQMLRKIAVQRSLPNQLFVNDRLGLRVKVRLGLGLGLKVRIRARVRFSLRVGVRVRVGGY